MEEVAYYRGLRYDQLQLKQVVKDFVQDVILIRPDDIICFAISYFTTFGYKTYKECPPKEIKESEVEQIFAGESSDFYGEFDLNGESEI